MAANPADECVPGFLLVEGKLKSHRLVEHENQAFPEELWPRDFSPLWESSNHETEPGSVSEPTTYNGAVGFRAARV